MGKDANMENRHEYARFYILLYGWMVYMFVEYTHVCLCVGKSLTHSLSVRFSEVELPQRFSDPARMHVGFPTAAIVVEITEHMLNIYTRYMKCDSCFYFGLSMISIYF